MTAEQAIETSHHQPPVTADTAAAEDTRHTPPQRFNKTHRIMLLFVIAVQLGMLGYDFVLAKQEQRAAAPPSSMTSPDTKELQRLLYKNAESAASAAEEDEYHLDRVHGKGNIRSSQHRLRELMPKSTKAPSIDSKSTKAPSIDSKSTKAPTFKSTKAPTFKSTKAPTLKSTKAPSISGSADGPTSSAFPTGAPTSSPTVNDGAAATIADFMTPDVEEGEIDI